MWDRFVLTSILLGRLPVNGRYLSEWVPQAWPYINPLQDVQAQNLAIEAGTKSRTGVIAERGEDPERIDAERKEDAIRNQQITQEQEQQT